MAEQISTAARTALARIGEAASQGPSTRGSQTSEAAHKRAFLETFRRWELLFRRRDSGNVEAEKWLIAEYYDSLRFLTVEGFAALTDELKRQCTFFPTVAECLAIANPGKHNYRARFGGDPRYMPNLFRASPPSTPDRAALTYGGDG